MSKKNDNIKEKIIRLEEKLIAAEKALAVADKSMQERLAGMNEFRNTLKDQASRFITRDELNAITVKYDLEIKALNKAKDMMQGKANAAGLYVAWIISGISVGIALLGLVLK